MISVSPGMNGALVESCFLLSPDQLKFRKVFQVLGGEGRINLQFHPNLVSLSPY